MSQALSVTFRPGFCMGAEQKDGTDEIRNDLFGYYFARLNTRFRKHH